VCSNFPHGNIGTRSCVTHDAITPPVNELDGVAVTFQCCAKRLALAGVVLSQSIALSSSDISNMQRLAGKMWKKQVNVNPLCMMYLDAYAKLTSG